MYLPAALHLSQAAVCTLAGLRVHVQQETKKSIPSSHAVIIVIMKREYLHYISSRIECRGQHTHCCLLAEGNGFKDLIIPEGL